MQIINRNHTTSVLLYLINTDMGQQATWKIMIQHVMRLLSWEMGNFPNDGRVTCQDNYKPITRRRQEMCRLPTLLEDAGVMWMLLKSMQYWVSSSTTGVVKINQFIVTMYVLLYVCFFLSDVRGSKFKGVTPWFKRSIYRK